MTNPKYEAELKAAEHRFENLLAAGYREANRVDLYAAHLVLLFEPEYVGLARRYSDGIEISISGAMLKNLAEAFGIKTYPWTRKHDGQTSLADISNLGEFSGDRLFNIIHDMPLSVRRVAVKVLGPNLIDLAVLWSIEPFIDGPYCGEYTYSGPFGVAWAGQD